MRRTKRKVVYTELSSSLSESPIDEEDFKESTSAFGALEEEALRIKIENKISFEEILQLTQLTQLYPVYCKVPDLAEELYMDDIDADSVRVFRPSKYPQMSKNCASFLTKLKLVLLNNDQSTEVSREEGHIDDLVMHLMRMVEFDDGINLTVKHCYLNLEIGSRSFSANADREGRKGLDVIWVLQESKHTGDPRYEGGDIQLISCMIAACQFNRKYSRMYSSSPPKRMFGIKTKGDQMYFYCMPSKEEYLRSLTKGVPLEELVVAKYPEEDQGLKLSDPSERRRAIGYLWTLRNHALEG